MFLTVVSGWIWINIWEFAMINKSLIWVRGAGELGSAVAHLLHRLGFRVLLSEIKPPLAIRRPVTFSDAMVEGSSEVEGVSGRYYTRIELPEKTPWKHIPVFEDSVDLKTDLHPVILVDARMLKAYDVDYRSWAELVIGLGPGFHTERNCHRVIETMRGHDLARVINQGQSLKDTGVPGLVGGETAQRIILAPRSGWISWITDFGEMVSKDQIIGKIDDRTPVYSPLQGIVRGLISPETPVTAHMKIGDIDPRGTVVNYRQISEKARAIAAGVLEAILLYLNQEKHD